MFVFGFEWFWFSVRLLMGGLDCDVCCLLIRWLFIWFLFVSLDCWCFVCFDCFNLFRFAIGC